MDGGLTYEDLYADLIDAQRDALPELYFTLNQFIKDTGLSYWVARKRLASRVENGSLGTRLANINGHSQRIWWFNGQGEGSSR